MIFTNNYTFVYCILYIAYVFSFRCFALYLQKKNFDVNKNNPSTENTRKVLSDSGAGHKSCLNSVFWSTRKTERLTPVRVSLTFSGITKSYVHKKINPDTRLITGTHCPSCEFVRGQQIPSGKHECARCVPPKVALQ